MRSDTEILKEMLRDDALTHIVPQQKYIVVFVKKFKKHEYKQSVQFLYHTGVITRQIIFFVLAPIQFGID